ncbi:MAG: metallophosphoesterase [Coriobacteriia bacterium]|nr:metallophosphoesterase [Coriobacteriia bacterium]
MTSERPTHRRTRFLAWARTAAVIALAVLAGTIAFTAAASAARTIGPLSATVQLAPSLGGTTTLAFPPFGTVSADTHAGILLARVRLDEVDVRALEELAAAGLPDEGVLDGWIRTAVRAVVAAGIRGTFAALVLAGLVTYALTRSRRLTSWVLAGTLLVCAASIALGALTFDASAFGQPTFNGALRYAPGALELVQDRIADIEGLQRQVGALASDLAAYYGVDQSFTGGAALPDTYRVLHVSDLHLDPVGMQLTMDLAKAYDVELIIDTGDISHFGTEQEAALAIAQMSQRPYVFVPGNHDSPDLVARIAASGVTVLDGETTITARGLVILGIADPASASPGVEPDSARARERGREVALERPRERFDIVAVHDPASGRPFTGRASIVLSGHTHTASYATDDGTVLLGSGTTGGVHFTELQPDPHIPHGASVLYFSRTGPGRLVAIDQIEVYGKTSQSSIKRTVIALGPEAPSETGD